MENSLHIVTPQSFRQRSVLQGGLSSCSIWLVKLFLFDTENYILLQFLFLKLLLILLLIFGCGLLKFTITTSLSKRVCVSVHKIIKFHEKKSRKNMMCNSKGFINQQALHAEQRNKIKESPDSCVWYCCRMHKCENSMRIYCILGLIYVMYSFRMNSCVHMFVYDLLWNIHI